MLVNEEDKFEHAPLNKQPSKLVTLGEPPPHVIEYLQEILGLKIHRTLQLIERSRGKDVSILFNSVITYNFLDESATKCLNWNLQ